MLQIIKQKDKPINHKEWNLGGESPSFSNKTFAQSSSV